MLRVRFGKARLALFLNSHLMWNGAFIYMAGGVKCL